MFGLWAHGVGRQKSGFSKDAQKWLAAAREPSKSYGAEAVWSQVLDTPEKLMMVEVGKRGSSNRMMQRLVVQTLADALCYKNRLRQIIWCFDEAYVKLRTNEPVTIFAHSLGVVLALEWLKARPSVPVAKFVTFGTNLELFHLGAEGAFVPPHQVSRAGSWVNYFAPRDALGWPVGGWIPHVKDVEVSVGSWLTSWNGLSHTGYFSEKSLWRRVASDLG